MVAALGLGFLAGCQPEGEVPEPEVSAHRVVGLAVHRQPRFGILREFAGVVVPSRAAEVGFEQSGRLLAIHVDEGDEVAVNQPLADLDTALLERERDELDAQLREGGAELALVGQNLDRRQRLQGDGFASQEELDELGARQRVLRATRERLRATRAAVETRLDKAILKAPFDAVVSRRHVDEGTVVTMGQGVLRLVERAPGEAHIGLPVGLAGTLAVGDGVSLRWRAVEVQGRVLSIAPEANPQTRTVVVRIALPPGLTAVENELVFARLQETIERPGFWLPLTALTNGPRGLWRVYSLVPVGADTALRLDPPAAEGEGRPYRLEARDVVVEHADGAGVFVTGALADGELVVSRGLHRLAPGQIVQLSAQGGAEATALPTLARGGEEAP
ncbi:MAG: efflux RND transporter periplasmic adaptor subunit [Candidatus Competibacterales bacterium]